MSNRLFERDSSWSELDASYRRAEGLGVFGYAIDVVRRARDMAGHFVAQFFTDSPAAEVERDLAANPDHMVTEIVKTAYRRERRPTETIISDCDVRPVYDRTAEEEAVAKINGLQGSHKPNTQE